MSKHILVVDDDERVLLVLRRALQSLGKGFEIVSAHGGRKALEKAKDRPFDLLVTDLIMPDIDGVELTEMIREQNPDLIVIWITAYGSHRFRQEVENLSVHACLEKPIWLEDVRQAVMNALESSAKSSAVEQREEEIRSVY